MRLRVNIKSLEELKAFCKSFKVLYGTSVEDYVPEETTEESAEPSAASAPRKKAGKRQPDHKKAGIKYKNYEPAAAGCLCGCGEDVEGGKAFVQGHHRRLGSIVGAVNADELDISAIAPHAIDHVLQNLDISDALRADLEALQGS